MSCFKEERQQNEYWTIAFSHGAEASKQCVAGTKGVALIITFGTLSTGLLIMRLLMRG